MKLAKDKWLHAIVAMVIFLIAAFWSQHWIIGVAVAMGAGLLKELWDKFNHKPFSIDDLFADLAGILIGSGVYIVFALLFHAFKVPGW